MTQTLVEFERSIRTLIESFENSWMHDISFIIVPPEIVAGFRGNKFTPEEFYSSQVWKESSHWNAAFVKGGKIVIFMYGHFHTLEKYLYVERIGSDPSFQSYGTKVWELMIEEAVRITKSKGFNYVWTVGWRKGEPRKFLSAKGGRLNTRKYVLETVL